MSKIAWGLFVLWGWGLFIPLGSTEVIAPTGERYVFNGSLKTETREYRYGCSTKTDVLEYDGLVVIWESGSTEPLFVRSYSTEAWETITYMGIWEDGTLGVVLQGIERDPVSLVLRTVKTTLMRIDPDGTVLSQKVLPVIMKDFHNHGFQLIGKVNQAATEARAFTKELTETEVQYPPASVVGTFDYPFQGVARINGEVVEKIALSRPGNHHISILDGFYEFSFSICVVPEITGISPGGEYDGSVGIDSEGELWLDDEPFVSGSQVTRPGNHVLSIVGQGDYRWEVPFVLHPVLENIDSENPSEGPVRLFSTGDSMELDGVLIPQGTLIAQSGVYHLRVYGINGYVREVEFAILPSVQGIADGQTVRDKAEFTVNGVATLNGRELHGTDQVVEEAGEHQLILWLGTERIETIRFTILASEEPPLGEADSAWNSWMETGLGVIVLLGLFLVLKKK